ncbi:retropepsin-like aspartic protease [Fluviicola chungangensis]|nr:retropepsin-like aspartic protease [Fluviicola chungangensis]
MKNVLVILLIFFSFFSEAQKKQPFDEGKFYLELEVLAQKKNFFEVKNLLMANKPQIDQEVYFYYWSLVENAFSNFKESNEAIENFLEGAGAMKNDSLFKEILMVKQLNLVNLFEYKDAYLTNQYILNNFSHVCTEDELADLANTGTIWKGLENSGKQLIRRPVDVKIQLSRDNARLANVPVTVSGKTKNFVFDTGANFSVIQRSVALEMGCEIIPVQFDVSAITGAKVKSDLAVVKELKMGDLICENVVFLVFDDKDLTFSEVNYSILGIIGFPVIRSLEEIRITKDDQLIIPKTPEVYAKSNMILNGFMPIVQVLHDSDTLQFSFDTGAVETSLNSAYYTKYKKKVDKKGKKKTLKSGGAGGLVEFEGYVLPKLTIAIEESEATLHNVQVRKDRVGETDADFDGNLGQDFIKQFNEMIISFKYSTIRFK